MATSNPPAITRRLRRRPSAILSTTPIAPTGKLTPPGSRPSSIGTVPSLDRLNRRPTPTAHLTKLPRGQRAPSGEASSRPQARFNVARYVGARSHLITPVQLGRTVAVLLKNARCLDHNANQCRCPGLPNQLLCTFVVERSQLSAKSTTHERVATVLQKPLAPHANSSARLCGLP